MKSTNNKYTTEPNTLGYYKKELDCGFIQDEINYGLAHLSQISIQNNHLGNIEKDKIKLDSNISIISNNEEKLQKINSKLENIKNSYNNVIKQITYK